MAAIARSAPGPQYSAMSRLKRFVDKYLLLTYTGLSVI